MKKNVRRMLSVAAYESQRQLAQKLGKMLVRAPALKPPLSAADQNTLARMDQEIERRFKAQTRSIAHRKN